MVSEDTVSDRFCPIILPFILEDPVIYVIRKKITLRYASRSRNSMNMNAFDILMVIAVGSMTGTGIGLIFGFLAKIQGNALTGMTWKEQILNGALIGGCSCVSCIALGLVFLR